jgi:hypothetical protein
MHKRADREVFGSWIFNTEQRCKAGSASNSICRTGAQKDTVTPWVGGDFNPFEMCDTVTDGDITDGTTIVQEMVSCSCNPSVCKDAEADYYTGQPSKLCMGKSGVATRPKWANLPKRVSRYEEDRTYENPQHFVTAPPTPLTAVIYDNNLCVHKPIIPSECKHMQGMLGGRQGVTMATDATNLYTDVTPRHANSKLLRTAVGMGLFVAGGNKMYSAEKTSENDALYHGIMKQNVEDLGGQHIVFKVCHLCTSAAICDFCF